MSVLRVDAPAKVKRASKIPEFLYFLMFFLGGLGMLGGTINAIVSFANPDYTAALWQLIVVPFLALLTWTPFYLDDKVQPWLVAGRESEKATKVYNTLNDDHKALALPVMTKIYELEKEEYTTPIGRAIEKRVRMLNDLKTRERDERAKAVISDADLIALEPYLNDESLRAIDSPRRI